VVGIKPIESGVVGEVNTDGQRLAAVSSFHVKQDGYSFAAPLSPHLAARAEGVEIRPELVTQLVGDARSQAEGVVLELAGGLFSPVTDILVNADLAKALSPDFLFLIAPDRLGVLHDVIATVRAAASMTLGIGGLILVTPGECDASTGRNAEELPRMAGVPVLAVLPRASPAELATLPAMTRLVEMLAAAT
jgi:dethiobiotin synthetase